MRCHSTLVLNIRKGSRALDVFSKLVLVSLSFPTSLPPSQPPSLPPSPLSVLPRLCVSLSALSASLRSSCLCLSRSVSVSLSISLHLCPSLSVSLCLYLSLSVTLCLARSLSLSLSLCLSLSKCSCASADVRDVLVARSGMLLTFRKLPSCYSKVRLGRGPPKGRFGTSHLPGAQPVLSPSGDAFGM